MARSPAEEAEAAFFRGLNAFVEPMMRQGCASPGILPSGLVVVETTGRKSGQPRRTPLAASVIEGHVLVSTFRGRRSEWLKNAIAEPAVRYWLAGEECAGRAVVLLAGQPMPRLDGLPQLIRAFAEGPLRNATLLGWGFAIIEPGPVVAAPAGQRKKPPVAGGSQVTDPEA